VASQRVVVVAETGAVRTHRQDDDRFAPHFGATYSRDIASLAGESGCAAVNYVATIE
jgi:hypothetical protein